MWINHMEMEKLVLNSILDRATENVRLWSRGQYELDPSGTSKGCNRFEQYRCLAFAGTFIKSVNDEDNGACF